MANIEQAGYPYVEGSYGIPFDQANTPRDRIVTGSGEILLLELKRRFYGVTTIHSNYHMNANLRRGELNLDLKTTSEIDGTGVHHPDLFAGRFADFAIANFGLNGLEITSLVTDWNRESLNFDQYMDALRQGSDKLTAARSTWTGRLAQRHGFDIHSEDHIDTEDPDRIFVNFRR